MNAEELMKQSYPTIEFEDKWDYLTQRFSADDMIHFAELYAQTKANDAERSSDKCHIQNVTRRFSPEELEKEYRKYYDKIYAEFRDKPIGGNTAASIAIGHFKNGVEFMLSVLNGG